MHLFNLLAVAALQCLLWRAQAAPRSSAIDVASTFETDSPESDLVERAPCPKVHFVGVRGDSSRPPYPYGAMQRTIGILTTHFPRSTDYGIKYVKQQFNSESEGTDNLITHLNKYTAMCPKTPIVIAGYSQGGIIAMNAICGVPGANPPLPKRFLNHVVAILTYGEESRTVGRSYNKGTCQAHPGLQPRQHPQSCQPYAKIIQSYCDYGDPDCCAGTYAPNHPDLHMTYSDRYSDESVKFVAQQLSKFNNGGQ